MAVKGLELVRGGRPAEVPSADDYFCGAPDVADKFERIGAQSTRRRGRNAASAGQPVFKARYAEPDRDELLRIDEDLKPVADGIKLYDSLPPEERASLTKEGLTRQKFAVMHAMCKAVLRDQSA